MQRVGVSLRQIGPVAHSGQSSQMALESIWIERNGVPVPAGSLLLPNETITLVAKLGFIGGDFARFTIRNAFPGDVVFGPVERRTGFFSDNVRLDTVAPAAQGSYILEVTDLRPFFPDDTKRIGFGVSATAPQPPKPPGGGGGGTLGKWTPWIIAGAILVGLVALSPSINTVIKSVAPGKKEQV